MRSLLAAVLVVASVGACGRHSSHDQDRTPPHVLSVSPAASTTTSAPATATVRVSFDEELDCDRLPAAALVVTEGGVPVPGRVACSVGVLEFIPTPALPTDTTLVAAVSPDVRDRAGNRLGADWTWSFHVQPWTRQVGTSAGDLARSVAIDAAGNLLVAGDTEAALDGNASAGGSDVFLMKLDPSGRRLWTRQLGSPALEYGHAVAVDGGGNAFVVGYTAGLLGGTSAGLNDLFVAKLDPDGGTVWTRQLGSASYDYATAVAVDAAGNVLVAGYTEGTLGATANAGWMDLFVVKLDPAGNRVWTRQLGTAGWDAANAVAADAAGNVFVAGYTEGSLDGNPNAGGRDAFVMKLDPSGATSWIRQLGTSGNDTAAAVAVDAAGDVLVTGGTEGVLGSASAGRLDVFVAKLDPSGVTAWIRQLGSAGSDLGASVAIDAHGNALVSGYTDGSFDGPNAGGYDVILLKLDPSGQTLWTRQLGTSATDAGSSVAVDAAGDAFVAGHTGGGLDGVNSAGGFDLFVVKYGPDGRKR